MADTVTYQLSSIDQSVTRTYIRFCLCFRRDSEQFDIDEIGEKLRRSAKRAITYMPILAGKVYSTPLTPSSDADSSSTAAEKDASQCTALADGNGSSQQGRVEVRVSPEDVNNFEPTIKGLSHNEFPYTYQHLRAAKMPATAFIDERHDMTPLPDMPDSEGGGGSGGDPVCAIQGNFICGGLFVMIYIHHSAADLQGVAAVIRHMSISEEILPPRAMTMEMLRENCVERGKMGDRLSGSPGIKANLKEQRKYNTDTSPDGKPSIAPNHGSCHVLGISLKMLQGARDLINERYQYVYNDPETHISAFDCLTAILWKGITRARWPCGLWPDEQKSVLITPVNISKRIEPALDDGYCGNVCIFSYTTKLSAALRKPYDIGSIAETALTIRENTSSVTDSKIRSEIAIINECNDARSVSHPYIDFNHDLCLTNWTNLPVGYEATLGLGLGEPEYMRKPSRAHSGHGCIILPFSQSRGIWEVVVQFTEGVMLRLLDDPGLLPFIQSVA